MSWEARPAVRSDVGLFVGFASEEGGGKTYSMLEVATGIVSVTGGRFAVIDTENRRALHYADFFDFDHVPFEPPYSSERYADAVNFCVKKGYRAIVLDSASHEHDGEGGYLDAQAADLEERVERMRSKAKEKGWDFREYDAIDKATPSSWIAPKRARKRMKYELLMASTSIPILFGFRAEEKVFGSEKDEKTGKTKLVTHNPPIWAPICGKGMPFEMTAFFLMHQDRPGVIAQALKLQGQHKELFPMDGKPLTRASGARIAQWARGAKPNPAAALPGPSTQASGADPDPTLTPDQVMEVEDRCNRAGIPTEKLKEKLGVKFLSDVRLSGMARAEPWIAAYEARRTGGSP